VKETNRAILDGAMLIAEETGAEAVILAAALPEEAAYLRQALASKGRRVIAASGQKNNGSAPLADGEVVSLPSVRLRRRGRAKVALLESLAAGLLHAGERVVVISGDGATGGEELDTVALVELTNDAGLLGGESEAPLASLSGVRDPAAFDALLGLCVALGHEGREGKAVGLLATLGDHEGVLHRSHPLVLNPFEGHPDEERCVLNPSAKRAVREFSGMDGAFVFRDDGVVVAAGRYLQDLAPEQTVPSGLGARHRAAAGITAATQCVAFVVSESSGETRVFGGGRLLMTIERTD
jgi:diadenylate cyclase